ncbi:MAG: FkbM family methyltransferase [Sandaracinaceae bacterium]
MNHAPSNLAEAVARSERLREAWTPEGQRGPVLISGDPTAWDAAGDTMAKHGVHVAGFVDLRWRVPRLLHRRRPILRGRGERPSRGTTLFAGTPHKHWFNRCSSALERCRWLCPPTGWKQRGVHRPALLKEQGPALARVFDALGDARSRTIFTGLIRARIEGDTGYHAISRHREYDHPLVRARPGDVVIDAGAYTGKSALQFFRQMRGRGTVVALEPSLASYRKLARWPVPGLIPLAVGAWHRADTLRFHEAGASGRITDGDGGTEVHVDRIDALVANLGLDRVDLLKFDVEGAEKHALEGAEQTIQQHRPAVQLSIYHRPEDLWTLPGWLFDRLEGYRYFFGHHGFYQTETDLYAVPSERLTGAAQTRR